MTLSLRFPLRSFVVTTVLVSAAGLLKAEDFSAAVSQARKSHYQLAAIPASRLITEDRLDEALEVFVRAVPEVKMTAADCFVVGEMFFRFDSAKAVKYYRCANDLLPDEPETNLELARSLHRTGNFTEAGIRYEQYLTTNPERFMPHALLAECLIKAGKFKEALEHWEKAYPEDNGIGIAGGIWEVHGPAHAYRRRADLLKAVRRGETARLEDLMALSAAWDVNGREEVNKPLLQRDVEMAKEMLVKEPQRLAELTVYANTYLEDVDAAWLKKELEKGGWLIGDNGRLPASARVAERLINLAVKHKLADIPTLLSRFEVELRRRSFGKDSNDVGAARLLAGLLTLGGKTYAAALPGVNLAGWQQYHEPMMAANFLATKLNENKLKYKSLELRRAMTEFPNHSMLCMLDLIVAKDESEPLRDVLRAAIPAECADLSASIGKIRDIERLKFMFNCLKEELALVQ